MHGQKNLSINKFYRKSGEIKIKVTRGYNQFLLDNDNFYKCLRTEKKDEKNIKLLMLVPCMKLEQIIIRSETNRLSPEGYIETIFKLLIELNEITNDKDNPNNIIVRFYGERHVKWRFFIFSSLNNKTMFIAKYKTGHPSSQVPMLKARCGNVSFCDSFNGYFDDVFKSNNESVISKKFINDDFGKTDNSFTKCKECDKKNRCQEIKNKYKAAF
uniref:Uncharacterized protein n=1 Tax=Candidatus Kentrum sp. TUN TaxID=2126343 RepID=A0A451AA22_9GAMM|nr:MAG: hypothetical protein BECKTUN1418F_GA0071002_10906 [Candidatus Kentron sp. TUN]VFK62880.1 MAG: hypothetical protein BECKTUN1418E_GA0071001_10887 [Candidatus Kentron sp. TUN]